ncbi:MAG TPA: right-handed parallel beta-helix repeat-containing protein [Tepidisphaeraceae bacterium]|jgi:titin
MKSTRNQNKQSKTSSRRNPLPLMEGMEGRRLFSTYVVTTTADSGGGSLRDAIKQANSHAGHDVINFKIGTGLKTIQTVTGLPYISGSVTIDATTQPGYSGKPLVELRGDRSGGYGLNVGGGNSTIKGLIINRYNSGILIVKNGGNVVQNCYIGTGTSGDTDQGNYDKGIIVQTANNLIGGTGANQGNVISGNGTEGVQFYLYKSTNNKLQGNKIGTNAGGTFAIPNGKSGVAVHGAPNNLVGGTTPSARNIISGNGTDGIVINQAGATGTVIQGNYIGTDVTGTKRVANLHYGVETSQPYTVVGGDTAAARNIVSGNGYTGVVLWLASGSNNIVQNNYIGTDVTGTRDVGNYWRGVDVSNGSANNLVKDNLISGNDIDGVMLYQGGNNTVQSNTIGFNASRTAALPNFGNGIRFTNAASAKAIGNFIGHNGGYGLFRTGGGAITLSANVLINDAIFNL